MQSFKRLPFLFSFLALFLGQVMAFESNTAFGKEYIDYETFVHLDLNSQKKVVLMVMDYMITAESMYPEKEPYISPQKRKTVETMKSLWNQIIFSSAYAQSDLDTSKLCLYGGWVSLMVNDKCTHPMNIAQGGIYAKRIENIGGEAEVKLKKSANEYKASSKSNTNCKATQNIVCSPEVFGTDTKGTPFCVGGNKDAKNTSLACFNKVHNDENKETILKTIVENALANPAVFSETLKMIYGTCMCQDNSYINQDYAKRIYDHRTCYGIIMQTRNILDKMFSENNRTNSCKLLDTVKYNDIAQMSDFAVQAYNNIKERFTDQTYTDLTKEDESYDASFIETRRGDLEKLEKQGICPLNFGYGVKLIPTDNKDSTYTITAELLGVNANAQRNIDRLEWNFPKGIKPIKEIDKLNIIMPQIKEAYKISATFAEKPSNEVLIPELNKGLTIVSEGPQDKVEILKANLAGVDPIDKSKFSWSLLEEGKGEIKGEEDKASATIPEKEAYKVKVTYEELSAEYEVKPIEAACTIAKKSSTPSEETDKKEEEETENLENEKAVTFVVTLGKEFVSSENKVVWSPAPSSQSEDGLEATYNEYKEDVITVTIGENSCAFSPEEDTTIEDPSGYALTITETSSDSNKSDFEAIIKKGDKEETSIPEGYDIIWYAYDVQTDSKDKDKKEEESVSYTEFNGETPSVNAESKIDTGKTTSLAKTDKDQKVYAELVKGDETIKSNELQVDKKKAAPVRQNLNNGPARPNTITPNIFRKGLGGQRGVF